MSSSLKAALPNQLCLLSPQFLVFHCLVASTQTDPPPMMESWKVSKRCGTWINSSFKLPNPSLIRIAHINHYLKHLTKSKQRRKILTDLASNYISISNSRGCRTYKGSGDDLRYKTEVLVNNDNAWLHNYELGLVELLTRLYLSIRFYSCCI